MAATRTPHVLIVGAGLGGLVLAQALRKQNVTFEIFDRDESLHSRFQGWCIGIHSILDDLVALLPNDLPSIDNSSHLRTLNLPAELVIHAKAGNFSVESGDHGKVVRADRAILRDLLATNLSVKYNAKAVAVEQDKDSVTVRFADGTSATGDLLVGADGANSIVRSQILPNGPPLRAIPNGTIVGETSVNKEQLDRQLSLGRSAYIGIADGMSLFVGLGSVAADAQSARYYWFLTWDDKDAARDPQAHWTARASKHELYAFAKEKSKTLAPELTEIIRLTGEEGIRQPSIVIRYLELEESGGLPVSRVTLLGDAAHAMTPFRGEGGVNAMIDALNLSRVITGSTADSVVMKLGSYQEEMLRRGGEAVRRSNQAGSQTAGSRTAWGQPMRPRPKVNGDGLSGH